MADKNLDHVLETLESATSLRVFRYSNDLAKDRWVEWDGEDPNEFLELARTLGDGVLYVSLDRVDPDDDREGWKDHRGEIAWLEGAFIRNGTFHLKTWTSEWLGDMSSPEDEVEEDPVEQPILGRTYFPDPASEDVTEDMEKLGSELVSGRQSLVDAFLEHVKGRSEAPPDPDYEWDVRKDFVTFMSVRLDLPRLRPRGLGFPSLPEFSNPQAREAMSASVREIVKRLRTRERESVEGAVADCESWAVKRGIPLRSLSIKRVREFADEAGLKLSRAGVGELRDRVSEEIKKKRGVVSHH